MNLHSIAAGVINAVNPNIVMTLLVSNGSVTNADGTRTPRYFPPQQVFGQVQELTTRDLRQLEGLNIQGSQRTIYMNGITNAIVRMSAKGGDLIELPDGTMWLTTTVLEQWPDWVKVAVTLQRRSATIPPPSGLMNP